MASSIFATLNTAKSGMQVHQGAITTLSHNIANASTDGYSRQRVNIVTTRAISSGTVGQIGTGAQIAAIERVRNTFLDYQVRQETAVLGKYSEKSSYLSQVEGIINEPSETGISTNLSELFDAFQELSKQSTSSSTRVVVAQKADSLCSLLNSTYTKLETLQGDCDTQIGAKVKEINSILDQITTLNDQIRIISITGESPNDLMDSRDLLLDELSSKFGIKIDSEAFNATDVYADGYSDAALTLVNSAPNGEYVRLSTVANIEKGADNGDGTSKYTLTYNVEGNSSKQVTTEVNLTEDEYNSLVQSGVIFTDPSGELAGGTIQTFSPANGEIAGIQEMKESIQSYMDELDTLAQILAYTINAIHTGSESTLDPTDPNYIPDFFVNSTTNEEEGVSAKNIAINADILKNPSLINAAESSASGEGDGTRALAMAQIQNLLLSVSSMSGVTSREELFDSGVLSFAGDNMTLTTTVGGTTIESYFQDTVDKLGVESQYAQRVVSNEEELLSTLELNRLSESGVSLDEEATSLIQYQQAYSASAKVITTINDMLDVLINMV